MPTRQEMLDRIYEIIADKTLSFGCRHISQYDGYEDGYDPKSTNVHIYKDDFAMKLTDFDDIWTAEGKELVDNDGDISYSEALDKGYVLATTCDNDDYWFLSKVIGHPVMIGDVLNWMGDAGTLISRDDSGNFIFGTKAQIDSLRSKKRRPIDDQSDECIQFIYSLLPTK